MRKGPHHEYQCTIICDCCSERRHYRSPTADELDRMIEGEGWVRFGPSGTDLCWMCRNTSPNTIVQVRKP